MIEVERDKKSISTLIVKLLLGIEWVNMYRVIIKGLVHNSGNWDKNIFDTLIKKGLIIKKIKHVKKSNYERAEDILRKII